MMPVVISLPILREAVAGLVQAGVGITHQGVSAVIAAGAASEGDLSADGALGRAGVVLIVLLLALLYVGWWRERRQVTAVRWRWVSALEVADVATRLLERRTQAGARLPVARGGWLLQGLDDPHLLLELTDWESREAFAAVERLRPLAGPEPGAFAHRLYRQLSAWESPGRPVVVVACLFVQFPPATGLGVRTFAEQLQEQASSQPGFGLHRLYQEVDDADRYLWLTGWCSRAAWERFDSEVTHGLDTVLRRLGARSSTFAGLTRLEYVREHDRDRVECAR
jgi:heme-degrading monooxygenase HmoA